MPNMDSVTGFRFEDSTRLSSQTEIAPVSERDLLQLQQRAQQGPMGHDVEESQKSHDDCGEKPPTVSKQVGGNYNPIINRQGLRCYRDSISGTRASISPAAGFLFFVLFLFASPPDHALAHHRVCLLLLALSETAPNP